MNAKENILIQTWIAHHKNLRASKEIPEETFWAFEELDELCRTKPKAAWKIILEILKLDQSDAIMANLAAGPLEDLLVRHGSTYIDKVERQAEKDPLFKHLLGGVWKNAMTNEVWTRVQTVAGKKW